MNISSYDANAPRPKIGSRWVWEPDLPYAIAVIEVVEVIWNGEEWWVKTKDLLGNNAYPPTGRETELNDLSRFFEACRPILPKLTGRIAQFCDADLFHVQLSRYRDRDND